MQGSDTKEIIRKYGLRLTKSLGQNFLNDESVVSRIADAIRVDREDLVLEVGPGAGSLTKELARRAGRVIAVEIDKHLIPVLKDVLKDFENIEILHADIMKVDMVGLIKPAMDKGGRDEGREMPTVGGISADQDPSPEVHGAPMPSRVKVAANLPYYITTPIIMKFLEENPGIDEMIFMVQKEVAERMVAKPGGKDYGALSVAVQYYTRPQIAFHVPPHCFIPQPEVDSTVIRLEVYKKPPVYLSDEALFFRIVKAAFGQRRKTLINALANGGGLARSKAQLTEILGELGIEDKRRGETLSVEEFARLANRIHEEKN